MIARFVWIRELYVGGYVRGYRVTVDEIPGGYPARPLLRFDAPGLGRFGSYRNAYAAARAFAEKHDIHLDASPVAP